MACHHCGHSEPVPDTCPDCASVSVARHGLGTERLEHELEQLLDPLPVVRLDADTPNPGALLRRFDAADAGVLVGTQMVAKGHDFPEVTLGLVIDADSVLRFPDFRSEERAFALVAQLAGRSGRGERGGRVLVQALDPAARALRFAAAHDSDGFLAGELARREVLRYPPFSHLIRVVCLSEEQGPELAAAEGVRSLVHEQVGDEAQVLGPAPLFRVKGRERAQVVIKAPARAAAVRAVRGAVESLAADRAHKGVVWSIDVDPQ
jgi:primosomal protein N' (replication factor Y)